MIPTSFNDNTDVSRWSRRVVHALFGLLGIILVALVVYSALKISEQREQQLLRADLETLTIVSDLRSAFQAAETGQRGYLLTSDSSYLIPYFAGRAAISTTIDSLRVRAHQSEALSNLIDSVELISRRKLDELQETIDLHSSGEVQAALKLVRTDLGKNVMDRARAVIDDLRDAVLQHAEDRFDSIQRYIFWLWVMVIVVVFLLIATLASVYESLRPLLLNLHQTTHTLRTRELELQQKNEQLENFAYIASHDLKEPVRTMTSFTQLLREDFGEKFDEEGQQYLNFIERAGLRIQRMIDGLLRYARVGSTGTAEPVELNELVDEILFDYRAAIEEKRARIQVTKLPTSYGRRLELRQLFQNLIANALKFHRPGEPPLVEITGVSHPERDEIRVRDHGIGIDAKFHDSIFQVFRRLHRNEEYEGTGIGLAYCRRVVESHGGTIRIESEPGQGSTFVVFLPKF